MTIADDLTRELASPPRSPFTGNPKGFEPGVRYVEGRPAEITTPAVAVLETQEDYRRVVESMGIVLPAGYVLRLVEAKYDPAAWHRDEPFIDDEAEPGRRTKAPAVTRPVWRYRFVPEIAIGTEHDLDLAELHKRAKKAARGRPVLPRVGAYDATMVVCLGDIQAGKVDFRGGTAELLERLEGSLIDVVRQVRRVKPAQIVLLDNGDAMEMFESAPGADRTNDLQQTEQLRVWRRLFWHWIETLAKLTDDLIVISVGSNHCRVRRGKEAMGTPADDYGIEVLSQVSDIAAANPEAFGHVRFIAPPEYDESVAFELVGGKILGAAHGHQKTRPEAIGTWLAGQALGRSPVGAADFLFIGHWHNLRVQTVGDDRWVFIVPTSDSGSSWYRNSTGDESASGVLTVVLDSRGWRDLHVCWQR